jgi:glycosyltransferase involved in cell wall biosynthesis
MDSFPLVSVLIPAFNAGNHIGSAIQSILDQTYTKIEIIVVNDGSTDNTLTVLQSFHDKIKLIDQENSGCSHSKNRAFEESTGQCIQYLDADDLLSPDKIERQVDLLMKNPGYISVCKTMDFYDDEGISQAVLDIKNHQYLSNSDDPAEFLIKLYGGTDECSGGGMIHPNAFLVERSLIEKAGCFNESISPSPDEDGEYFCRVILASKGILYSDKGINYYRQYKKRKSLSRKFSYDRICNLLKSTDLKLNHILKMRNDEKVHLAFARQYAGILVNHCSEFPDLTNVIMDKINQLGYSDVKTLKVTGYKFNMLSNLIGLQNTLLVRNYFWDQDNE